MEFICAVLGTEMVILSCRDRPFLRPEYSCFQCCTKYVELTETIKKD